MPLKDLLIRQEQTISQPKREESLGSGELISDERIREIIERFLPILYRGISEANTFFMRSAGQTLAAAVPMRDEEINLWQRHHQVVDKTLEAAQKGKLYVPEIEIEDDKLLTTLYENEEHRSSFTQLSLQGERGRKFRVNLDETIQAPIQPFDAQETLFLVRPHAHLGGRGGVDSGGRPALYNAFIGLDTYVQDRFGRWVIKPIAGTTPGVDGPSWVDGPAYSPYMPARSSVWFNTRIDEKKQNKLEVGGEGQFDMTFQCEIHHPGELDELEIPDNGRLRFFFWQLDSFLMNPALGNGGIFPLLESGKK